MAQLLKIDDCGDHDKNSKKTLVDALYKCCSSWGNDKVFSLQDAASTLALQKVMAEQPGAMLALAKLVALEDDRLGTLPASYQVGEVLRIMVHQHTVNQASMEDSGALAAVLDIATRDYVEDHAIRRAAWRVLWRACEARVQSQDLLGAAGAVEKLGRQIGETQCDNVLGPTLQALCHWATRPTRTTWQGTSLPYPTWSRAWTPATPRTPAWPSWPR